MSETYTPKKVNQDKQFSRENIEAIEKTNPALARLNSATIDKPRGFEITKAELLNIVQETDDRAIQKIIALWKLSLFWVRGISVDYSHKIKGYVFPHVDTELRSGHDRRMASTERKLKKEALRLSVIRDDELSDHDKRRRLLLANAANDSAGKINSQRSMAVIWSKQPETLPRLNAQG